MDGAECIPGEIYIDRILNLAVEGPSYKEELFSRHHHIDIELNRLLDRRVHS
jgi:hypothetical protein